MCAALYVLSTVTGYVLTSALLLKCPNLLHRKKRETFRSRHISHRGGAGENLENTMAAFKHAVDLGTDMLELDCHLTKDEEVVVSHDASLQRASGINAHISNMCYAARSTSSHMTDHMTDHTAPQGCVLSPLLFTLLTHDCKTTYSTNHLVKFADDTTLIGLITKDDETLYRKEVNLLTTWCGDNNLLLNNSKTKEIVVDFRKGHTHHPPLTINGADIERVSSTKFLGVDISEDLSWTANTSSLAKKAQRRLYFLRKLRKAGSPPSIMCTFYRGTIESILTSSITVWGGSCTDYNRKALQRIVNAAGRIIGASLPPLPSLQDIYDTRLTRKVTMIVSDSCHPSHGLFSLLPSGRRYRSLRARTTRLSNSFIHQAVRKLNSLPTLPLRPL